jgi:D-3-phosphoglycerate dehydrogenase
MAKKLSGFDVKVLAYDKYLENYSDQYVKQSAMNEIFEQADIVSFHLPITPETLGLVNQDYIEKFKKGVFIINTSRGKILDTNSLLFGLNSGKILGACLDVFENENQKNYTKQEKISFSQLFNHKKVILSPHIAGWTLESKEKLAQTLINKILIKHS